MSLGFEGGVCAEDINLEVLSNRVETPLRLDRKLSPSECS